MKGYDIRQTKFITVGDYETIFEIEIKDYYPFTDIVKFTTRLHLSSYELKEAVLSKYSAKKFEEEITELKSKNKDLEQQLKITETSFAKKVLENKTVFPKKSNNNKNNRRRR